MSSSTVILEVLFFAKAREILKTSESQITIATNVSSAQGNLIIKGYLSCSRHRTTNCPNLEYLQRNFVYLLDQQ